MHWLASKYGWTLGYVMDLTRRQVRILMESEIKIMKMSPNTSSTGMKKDGKKGDFEVNDPLQLLNMKGVQLTPRAKKALLKRAGIKLNKNEVKN